MTATALITGASSGIGKILAQIHAEQGGSLIIIARSADKLEQLKAELESQHKVSVMMIVQDLTLPDAPQNIYDMVKEADIAVDYLINNAGFGGVGAFYQREWADDAAMIQLNVMALTHLSRLFLPDMLARNRGRILNVSSTASLLPGPLQAVYYAAKAYVSSFSNAIAEELRGTNITVTNLMPGATETEFGQISGMDKTALFKQTANARDVAEDGYNAMLAGQLNKISGVTLMQKLMLKLIPFTPKKMLLKTLKRLQTSK